MKQEKKKIFQKIIKYVLPSGSMRTAKGTQNAINFVKTVAIFVCVLLVARIALVQFVEDDKYVSEAFNRQYRGKTIPASRGTIYDRNGNVLAVSVAAYSVTVDRKNVKLDAENSEIGTVPYLEKLAKKMTEYLGVDYASTFSKLLSYSSESKSNGYWLVKSNVDIDDGDKFKAWMKENNIKNITVDDDTKRYYPQGSLASHVIGFTGSNDQGLVCGIELALNSELSGVPGKIIAALDTKGNVIAGTEVTTINAVQGHNVELTLDTNIQKIAEDALKRGIEDFGVIEGGSVIVMNAKNADVLAMVSDPDFDLNNPYNLPESIDKYLWYDYREDPAFYRSQYIWRNRAISDAYEPGSTFKSVTGCIVLEEGIVTPDTVFSDAPLELAGWTIHCWEDEGHGDETFAEALANSCNPIMARAALKAGVKKYYSYVKAFGFYEKTNILLSGEGVGVMHVDPEEIDLAVTAFGQRFTVTPIQMAATYVAIANGGTLFEPRIVTKLTDEKGNVVQTYSSVEKRKVVSTETTEEIIDILKKVVEGNGGGVRAYNPGYIIAGKTGTSETTTTETTGRYVVSYAAIAPADDPEVIIIVVLDHPTVGDTISGGVQAASVVKEIVKNTLDYLGVEKTYTDTDRKNIINVYGAPKLEEMTLQDAIYTLRSSTRGYTYEVIGPKTPDAIITGQYPAAGTYLCRDAKIIIYTQEDTSANAGMVRVPNVIGLPLEEAHSYLISAGLNVYAVSMGEVKDQDIKPGTFVEKGTVVSLKFGG